MRKMLLFCLLGLTPFLSPAQIPVIDGLSNKQLIQQLVKWVQDYAKQTGQEVNLQKILGENTTTQEKITALLTLKMQIEQFKYSVADFKKLRISDLSTILENVYGLGTMVEYGEDLPFLKEYGSLTGKLPTATSAQQVYDYLFAGTSAYESEAIGTFDEYLEASKEQHAKTYTLHLATQKRKMAAAMTYQRMADEYTRLAEDLSLQVNTEGEQRLTTGERIKAQKMANDYMVQALEMKQKADQLLKEAAQKTGLVEQIDQARQNYLNRKEMAEKSLY
jgi:hypothetical protein